ncbi:caspase family protein [Nonomuraea sp. CA-143628]|uniref:caspase family protein n=1 Tax=Nonomuraea sp. CA-143628 TaxID=3239997 RepID=UPI003D8FF3B0
MTRLHAVLIGVNKYADITIPDLSYARADALAFAELFGQALYASSVQVHSLVDDQATRSGIIDLVGVRLARIVDPRDAVLIFFAGHGSPEIHPGLDKVSRFLVCHDTQRHALLSSAIEVHTDLARLASRLNARLVVFILDACFSGYSDGRGITGPLLAEQRRTHRPRIRLENLPLGSGTIFLSACADDEVAREDGTLGHGVFSYYLLEQLRSPGATNVIGLASLYDLVFHQVRDYSNGRQNPVLWGDLKGAGLPRLLIPGSDHG